VISRRVLLYVVDKIVHNFYLIGLRKDGKQIKLYSRTGNDLTHSEEMPRTDVLRSGSFISLVTPACHGMAKEA